jgi:hypothetical protein
VELAGGEYELPCLVAAADVDTAGVKLVTCTVVWVFGASRSAARRYLKSVGRTSSFSVAC